MRLLFSAILLHLFTAGLFGQTFEVSQSEPESYIALTPTEFEALMARAIALRRQQLWLQQQQLRAQQFPQANAPATGAVPTTETERRIAELEQLLTELRRTSVTDTVVRNPPVLPMAPLPTTTPITTTNDPRLAALDAEVAQLRRTLAEERDRNARDYDNSRELERYDTENRVLRAESEYELDRLRREGKLDERRYRYERNLLRERNRQAKLDLERQRLAEVPVTAAPTTTTPRPSIIPVPFTMPGGRDTVIMVSNDDAALRAEIQALRASIAALEGRTAAAPTVITAPPTVVERTVTVPASTLSTKRYPAILFANGSAELPANYLSVVRAVADAYRKGRITELTVTGYASPTGPAALNQALSQRRADTVITALVAAGIPTDIIQPIYGGINYQYAQAPARRVDIEALGSGL